MDKQETYEEWLSKLESLAEFHGTHLHLDKYHCHTYFMRGYLPEGVIEDIKASCI